MENERDGIVVCSDGRTMECGYQPVSTEGGVIIPAVKIDEIQNFLVAKPGYWKATADKTNHILFNVAFWRTKREWSHKPVTLHDIYDEHRPWPEEDKVLFEVLKCDSWRDYDVISARRDDLQKIHACKMDDFVWVILTERGKKIYEEKLAQLASWKTLKPPVVKILKSIEGDGDDFHGFMLDDLMEIFGKQPPLYRQTMFKNNEVLFAPPPQHQK